MRIEDFPEGLKTKIIEYCYQKMDTINQKFLKDNDIRPGMFMEIMYERALINMRDFGQYEISDAELQQIFVFVKNTENILKGFLEGKNDLVGIRDDENLIFKVRRQLEY